MKQLVSGAEDDRRRVNEWRGRTDRDPHSGADQILVQMPGVTDVRAQASSVHRHSCSRMVDRPVQDERGAPGYGNNRRGIQILPTSQESSRGHSDDGVLRNRRVPAVTGRDLRNARPSLDQTPPRRIHAGNEGSGESPSPARTSTAARERLDNRVTRPASTAGRRRRHHPGRFRRGGAISRSFPRARCRRLPI